MGFYFSICCIAVSLFCAIATFAERKDTMRMIVFGMLALMSLLFGVAGLANG